MNSNYKSDDLEMYSMSDEPIEIDPVFTNSLPDNQEFIALKERLKSQPTPIIEPKMTRWQVARVQFDNLVDKALSAGISTKDYVANSLANISLPDIAQHYQSIKSYLGQRPALLKRATQAAIAGAAVLSLTALYEKPQAPIQGRQILPVVYAAQPIEQPKMQLVELGEVQLSKNVLAALKEDDLIKAARKGGLEGIAKLLTQGKFDSASLYSTGAMEALASMTGKSLYVPDGSLDDYDGDKVRDHWTTKDVSSIYRALTGPVPLRAQTHEGDLEAITRSADQYSESTIQGIEPDPFRPRPDIKSRNAHIEHLVKSGALVENVSMRNGKRYIKHDRRAEMELAKAYGRSLSTIQKYVRMYA